MIYERQANTGTTIDFPLIAWSLTSFHNSLTTTLFAAGDIKISKNYGDFTNTATLPASCPNGMSVILSLTSDELIASHIHIQIKDQTSPKVWEDQAIIIETFGTTTAQFLLDRNNPLVALNASGITQVNSEVVDALGTDTIPELAQAIPSATPTIKQAIMLPYMALRNKLTVDATTKKIHNDAGTNIVKKTISDNGTTYTEDEAVAGS